METNETFEPLTPEPGLKLSLEAQGYLRETGKWAYFLGILGFIGAGFVLIAALFVGTIMSMVSSAQPSPISAALPAAMGGFLSFIYILVAVFYFFFSLYLYQFGSRIKKGILFADEMQVTVALGKLKSFFKMWGITTIVVIALYAVMLIIVVLLGVGAASMMRR